MKRKDESKLPYYHKGKQSGDCSFGNSVPKEKPQESVEGNYQKAENCDAHNLKRNMEMILCSYVKYEEMKKEMQLVKQGKKNQKIRVKPVKDGEEVASHGVS